MTAETELSLGNFYRSTTLQMSRARFNIDLARLRSWCAQMAVDDGYDVLWLVDHDVGFKPEIPQTMLQLLGQEVDGKPIECISAAYPKRNINLRAIFEAGWNANASHGAYDYEMATENAARNCYEWPHVEIPGETPIEPGILRVAFCGAGMLMVKTTLLKRMQEKFGDYPPNGLRCKARRGPKDDVRSYKEAVMLFHQIPTRDGLLSEDHSFCQRVRDTGADVWLYVGEHGVCSHTGPHTFLGDVRDVIKVKGDPPSR